MKDQCSADICFLVFLLLPSIKTNDRPTSTVLVEIDPEDISYLLEVNCSVVFLSKKTDYFLREIVRNACSSVRSAGTSVLLLFESRIYLIHEKSKIESCLHSETRF